MNNRPLHTFEALSNIAYLLAGIAVFVIQPAAWVPALALIFLAIGSYACHLNIKTDYCYLDWAGMFAAFMAFIAWGLLPEHPFLQLVLTAVAGYLAVAVNIADVPQEKSYPVIGLLWILATILNFSFVAIFLFAVGFGIRQLGATKYDTNRDEEILHGVWHLITALAFIFMI